MPPLSYTPRTEPFEHQRAELEQHWLTSSRAILWEQGLGKTKLLIDTAGALWEAGEIDALLVVAPNGVHRNWMTDEIPAHLPARILKSTSMEYWDTPRSRQVGHRKRMDELVKHSGFSILLISYDGFMSAEGKKFVWRFLRRRRCLYTLDEAHNIKSPGAKRTKSIVASGRYASYKRILTGTPVAVGPFDLYSQFKFLDENFWKRWELSDFRVFKNYFGEWLTRAEAQEQLGYDPGYDKLVRYRNTEKLSGIVAQHSSRHTKDEVLKLPAKLYSKRYFEMTSQQRSLYQQLEEDFLAEMEDGSIIDGRLAIVRLLRFQQVLCGYAYTDSEEEPVQMLSGGNPRMGLLEDLTDSLYNPAIIWARFTRDIDQIMRVLGSKAVRYDGQVSDDEAARAKSAFQSGAAQFFVGNPAKGKEGLTLTQAHTVVYYNNSFKLIDRLQSEDRAHRIGLGHPVDYVDLVCAGTVDTHIVRNLREKRGIAGILTGDELKEWI